MDNSTMIRFDGFVTEPVDPIGGGRRFIGTPSIYDVTPLKKKEIKKIFKKWRKDVRWTVISVFIFFFPPFFCVLGFCVSVIGGEKKRKGTRANQKR